MHRRTLLTSSSTALLLLLSSCGGQQVGTGDPAAQNVQLAYQHIEGSWKLVTFEPATALGAPFDALVNEQLGQLKLMLTAGSLSATGAGLNVNRTYEITSATPDAAQGVLIDDAGVRYEFDLLFQGNDIFFVSKTDPWRGRGTLTRTTPVQ